MELRHTENRYFLYMCYFPTDETFLWRNTENISFLLIILLLKYNLIWLNVWNLISIPSMTVGLIGSLIVNYFSSLQIKPGDTESWFPIRSERSKWGCANTVDSWTTVKANISFSLKQSWSICEESEMREKKNLKIIFKAIIRGVKSEGYLRSHFYWKSQLHWQGSLF